MIFTPSDPVFPTVLTHTLEGCGATPIRTLNEPDGSMPVREPDRIRVNSIDESGRDQCSKCGIVLDGRNTKGQYRGQRKGATIRCGKCYLKWRREMREKEDQNE